MLSEEYLPKNVELARQEAWAADNVHRTIEDPDKEKYFIVDMFPYPSGTGIHLGHVKNYVATDVQARVKVRQGFSVLHPMGYDSFGLPAENYALSQGIHPREAVEANVEKFGNQLRRLGLGYDWDREINTIDDEFVKWTQDGFLTLYENGLVSEEEEPINWCGSCETGLSNEDLEGDNCCERCGNEVERRLMRQWSVHITDYADDLIEGMDELTEWEPFLLDMQRNWIGKKEGWSIESALTKQTDKVPIKVFTTTPEALAGAEFLAISPEKVKALNILDLISDTAERDGIADYIENRLYKGDKDRKPDNGVRLPLITFTNPFNGEELPVFVAEYVLPKADDGFIIGNSTQNKRDEQFIGQMRSSGEVLPQVAANNAVMTDIEKELLGKRIIDTLKAEGKANPQNIYRLEDWVFSRQRFWGEPIPLVHCADCGVVPVPRDQLPVLLPDVESYTSTGTGESPLTLIDEWVNTCCPDCDGPAKRETNTMPQWAGSSWYWHRYKDPHNTEQMVSPVADAYWGQVDMYVGGAEHAARHLIYARFWNMVLEEAGVVRDKEPFKKVQHVGLVMDEHGVKISKRLGNGVNIDSIVEEYGADALRLGMMQMGEFSQQTNWDLSEIKSARKFINKIWKMQDRMTTDDSGSSPVSAEELNRTIEKVTDDVLRFKFNTAIAAIRTLVNELEKKPEGMNRTEYEVVLSLLQPFIPHTTEQIAINMSGKNAYYMQQAWPGLFAVEEVQDAMQEVVLMINGKKVGLLAVASSVLVDEDDLLSVIREQEDLAINQTLATKSIKRVVVPKGKGVVNFVVE